MRQMDKGKSITATTRQLESLIRLSEASAKLHLKKCVFSEDVDEAYELLKESMLLYAIDPITGKIDMDLVNTGSSNFKRRQIEELRNQIVNKFKRTKQLLVNDLYIEHGDLIHDVLSNLCLQGDYVLDNGLLIKTDE
ncbi:hypothetical protein EDEG_00329 [Edhazardia aedis USNM 41457]|uniref:MCM AAA-lid domain-containing protein n=1 Tax=Edhazardia aedis (strain USNM 41457) TaxID=1003232 RepID=J9D2U3_EDHAE|nr:hypothetical protein EDEG_00329 [Edhazardia aedis USNM 41457]|eukprot:EJW01899.1 hypothetical protein EDEG_00329 [Edhazardia aedis USNM 41457]